MEDPDEASDTSPYQAQTTVRIRTWLQLRPDELAEWRELMESQGLVAERRLGILIRRDIKNLLRLEAVEFSKVAHRTAHSEALRQNRLRAEAQTNVRGLRATRTPGSKRP